MKNLLPITRRIFEPVILRLVTSPNRKANKYLWLHNLMTSTKIGSSMLKYTISNSFQNFPLSKPPVSQFLSRSLK